MGADTHGEPFYKNPPKQQNTIASFDDACEAVAKEYGFSTFKDAIKFNDDRLDIINGFYRKAAELYAESKAREAWIRACGIDREYYMSNAPKPEYKP